LLFCEIVIIGAWNQMNNKKLDPFLIWYTSLLSFSLSFLFYYYFVSFDK
jgi:hypothetical protein